MQPAKQPRRDWTPFEDDELKRMCVENVAKVHIGRRLNRTTQAVYSRCKFLGITKDMPYRWSPQQEQKFAQLYVGTRLSMIDIAAIMRRTIQALNNRAQLLDLPSRHKAWKDPDLIMQVFNIPQPGDGTSAAAQGPCDSTNSRETQ